MVSVPLPTITDSDCQEYRHLLAIQLAKLSGFSQIIATASLHNAPFLKSIGATTVVDRKAQNLQAEINKAVKGVPIDVVLDAISLEDTQSLAWDVLAPDGTLVLLLDATVDRSKYPKKMIVNDIYGSVHAPHLRALGVSLYAALPKLIETRAIKVRCTSFRSILVLTHVSG